MVSVKSTVSVEPVGSSTPRLSETEKPESSAWMS